MTPKIKFVIDAQADTSNARWFVRNSEFVNWFLPKDLKYITDKTVSSSKRNEAITKYTKTFYKINRKVISKGVEETRKRWAKIEKKFYCLVERIFQGHAWPKGKYMGYASIFLMYPRNIGSKTFYFPYSKDRLDPTATIAHEILHFMFFDYIEKNYGLKEHDKFKGKNPKYLWQVSETFNTVIENWLPYKKIFNATKDIKPYPGCGKMYASMAKQWSKKQDIKNLLDKWLAK